MKKYRVPLLVALATITILWIWTPWGSTGKQLTLSTTVIRDVFKDEVVSSGELMAKNAENIVAPAGLQRYGIYQIKIANMVDEGTYVEPGEFVAALDKSDITAKINEKLVELDKANSVYTQTQLDTALTLREKRNELENLAFQIKQKEIELQQSVYEPPATVQRIQLDLEKLRDDLVRKKDDYQIKEQQSRAKMIEAGAELQQTRNQLQQMQDLEKEFSILAPKRGMVTYYRSWNGKVKSGSTIQPWNPVVATLPDLSKMLSLTYINEVDIRKVQEGQEVLIGLDAFPEVQLHGKVVSVANMGESREGADSKVFEVEIEVTESDSLYRPGMTTSNRILIDEQADRLQVPLEAVFGNDSLSFVYKRTGVGVSKQQVQLGSANDERVVIAAGLEEGDEVLLNAPANGEQMELKVISKSL